MTKLTKYEKETIILFNEGEAEASIYTHNKRWQRHLENKLELTPTEINEYGGKTYILPKSRIPLPRRKREVSEEQKKKLADRLRKPPTDPENENTSD